MRWISTKSREALAKGQRETREDLERGVLGFVAREEELEIEEVEEEKEAKGQIQTREDLE